MGGFAFSAGRAIVAGVVTGISAMNTEIVKSVGRVLEVLELFQRRREALNATDICAQLNYPRSSANALLKSMVTLGYLSFDLQSMRYFPSLRVTKLGDWIPGMLFGGEAMNILEQLHGETRETVTLSMQNGLSMQFITVLPGTFPISLTVSEGFLAPLFGTAVGTALLSTFSDKRIEKLIKRAKKERVSVRGTSLETVRREVEEARERGYALAYERILPDTGAIAMPLPAVVEEQTLVVGVGGLSGRIKESQERIIQKMTRAIGRYASARAVA